MWTQVRKSFFKINPKEFEPSNKEINNDENKAFIFLQTTDPTSKSQNQNSNTPKITKTNYAKPDESLSYCLILRRELTCDDPTQDTPQAQTPLVEHFVWNYDLSITRVDNLSEFTCNDENIFNYLPLKEKEKGLPVCNYLWNFVPSESHRGFYSMEAGVSDMYLSLTYPMKNAVVLEYNKYLPRQLWALEPIEDSKFSLKSYFTGKQERLFLNSLISSESGKDPLLESMQSIFGKGFENGKSAEAKEEVLSSKGFQIFGSKSEHVPVYQVDEEGKRKVKENVFVMIRAYSREKATE
jgi:hypothetical protein